VSDSHSSSDAALDVVLIDVAKSARYDAEDHSFNEVLDAWQSAFAHATKSKPCPAMMRKHLVYLASAVVRLAAHGDKGSTYELDPPWVPCSHEVACGEFARGGWVRAEHWLDGTAIRATDGGAECSDKKLTHDVVREMSAQLLHNRFGDGSTGLTWERHPAEEMPF